MRRFWIGIPCLHLRAGYGLVFGALLKLGAAIEAGQISKT